MSRFLQIPPNEHDGPDMLRNLIKHLERELEDEKIDAKRLVEVRDEITRLKEKLDETKKGNCLRYEQRSE